MGIDVKIPLDLSSEDVQRLNLRRGGQSGSSSSPLMSLRMASRAIVSTVLAFWLDSRDRSKTSRKLIGVTFHSESHCRWPGHFERVNGQESSASSQQPWESWASSF